MLLTPERSEHIKARIQSAVEAALRARGISARRASLDVVGNDGLIRDIRAGRLPGVDRLEALFEYLGIEFHFGPRPARRDTGFAEPLVAAPAGPEALRAGYLPIPWHPQATPPDALPAAPVAFARAWLERERLDPACLAALVAKAPEGAEVLALVDVPAPRRGGPAMWCYRRDGRLQLAPMQFEPNATIIFSTEPGRAAQVLAGADRAWQQILGRVVWSARREPAA